MPGGAVHKKLEGESLESVVEEIEEILGRGERGAGESVEAEAEEKPKSLIEEVFEKAQRVDSIVFLRRGQTIKCRVVDIRGDIYGNIFPKPSDPERLKIWEKKFNRFVWLLLVECPEHGIKFIDILSLSLHPNSRYVRLKKCYNVIRVGSEVFVGEEQGRIKIVCPEE